MRNSVFLYIRIGSSRSTNQNSAKFTPAMTMNGTNTHWTTGLNAAMLSACGENPPVGSVEKPCAIALYRFISGASGVSPRPNRIAMRARRESGVDDPEGPRGLGDPRGELLKPGAGASDFISSAPLTANCGRIATISTMIPIPPSHCVS